jgi:hypothetical protein
LWVARNVIRNATADCTSCTVNCSRERLPSRRWHGGVALDRDAVADDPAEHPAAVLLFPSIVTSESGAQQ